ncbi:uncharacterized protein LOC144124582 [Amblyomma americanum]
MMDPDSADDPQDVIMKECLRDLKKTGDKWTGYLQSDEELQAFEKKLAAVHVQFSTTSSTNHKCGASQLMFSSNRGTVPVSLDMPFQVVRQVDKDCVLGIGHHKDKWESTSTAQDPTDWSSEVFCKKKKDQAARNQEEGVHCKHASKVDQHVPRIQG